MGNLRFGAHVTRKKQSCDMGRGNTAHPGAPCPHAPCLGTLYPQGLGLSGEEARKPLQNIRRGQTELWLPHLLLL